MQVVTRKEDDGSWKVTTDFMGSRTMLYLISIVRNNWTNGWSIDQDGTYLISLLAEEGDDYLGSGTTTFEQHYRAFLDPRARE